MIRIFSCPSLFRYVCATIKTAWPPTWPYARHRSSSSACPSEKSSISGSPKTLIAYSKLTPCFFWFERFLASSHSKSASSTGRYRYIFIIMQARSHFPTNRRLMENLLSASEPPWVCRRLIYLSYTASSEQRPIYTKFSGARYCHAYLTCSSIFAWK